MDSKKIRKLKEEVVELLEEKERRQRYNYKDRFYPSTGPYSREHYPKHMEFMRAGSNHRQRAFIAGNRTGKTLTGAYELSCHLTGEYPDWWEGKKFFEPISAWAASVSNTSTRDIIQKELLGELNDIGTGMLPKDVILDKRRKPGVPDSIDTIYVKHVSGGTSIINLKSYEEGREKFQGTKKHVIWLDEEPSDARIYSECLTRTAGACADGSPGIIFCTFTPLMGVSDTVLKFLPDGKFPIGGEHPEERSKYVVAATWDDIPHLSEQDKAEMLAEYSPHEREARSKGIPSLGSGAIFPYPEDLITVSPFEIPIYWPKVYGMDVGWNRTAALWGAFNPDTSELYIYSEHYMGNEPPPVHAASIRARGEWIPGVIDPASLQSSKVDGLRLLDIYHELGLDLQTADNSVEAGIYKINQFLAGSKLKVFNTLQNFLAEYRTYHRDEKGKIVKKNDHLMDALRYLVMSGLPLATTKPDIEYADEQDRFLSVGGSQKNPVTGY